MTLDFNQPSGSRDMDVVVKNEKSKMKGQGSA